MLLLYAIIIKQIRLLILISGSKETYLKILFKRRKRQQVNLKLFNF